ncbi:MULTISPECIES: pyrroline-5-carboxylate reductase dimerization domain-containing protein [Campylobacter]|uniref:pyrroline-5-carboxylate reductase dimerization domain-containing protein n=1 Tax=Campylobacter TaxID=194 RepID=UPI000A32B4B4|nr:pyrroline-5-carboxylate reductase dimerization domain-containing protein [Campylobacter sp. P0124]MCR8696589.1 NAD(P)-binding domain-containing protein [Campylobacter sp. RM19073]
MKITIIGAGNMGLAMANGLKSAGFEVVLAGRFSGRLEALRGEFNIEIIDKNYDINDKNIILAIKPNALEWFKNIANGKANSIISVLARTSLEQIQAINAINHAICLPNIAAKDRASINPYMASGNIEIIEQILNGFGKAVKFDSKATFDAASIISGCAPAYLALVADAINSAAVRSGLNLSDAQAMTSGLFNSFATLIENRHPALIRDSICSPAGTTIEGVCKLEEAGVRTAFIEAIKASLIKQRG